jgi:hypothetical protein
VAVLLLGVWLKEREEKLKAAQAGPLAEPAADVKEGL